MALTLTIHPECESITVESSYFDETNQTVVLNVTVNCETEYVINAEPEDTEIVVDVDSLGLTDLTVLEDSVYYLELVITQEDGTVITESACRYLNCSTTCLMLDTFKDMAAGDEDATIRSLAFHALTVANGCTSCACSDLCTLYNATQIDECTANVSTCGCS